MPDPNPMPKDIAMPDGRHARRDDDPRSDIEQAVAARSDALERGEGGPEAAVPGSDPLAPPPGDLPPPLGTDTGTPEPGEPVVPMGQAPETPAPAN